MALWRARDRLVAIRVNWPFFRFQLTTRRIFDGIITVARWRTAPADVEIHRADLGQPGCFQGMADILRTAFALTGIGRRDPGIDGQGCSDHEGCLVLNQSGHIIPLEITAVGPQQTLRQAGGLR